MLERHEHLPLTQLPQPPVVFDDGVATRESALVPQPLEDSLGRVTLLLRLGFVLLQDLVDSSGPGVQLRPPRRLLRERSRAPGRTAAPPPARSSCRPLRPAER